MTSAARCQIIAIVLLAICGTSVSLKVAAFNVKTFVPSKVDNDDIRGIIAQIVMQYDIILIQEIRGDGAYVMATLKDEITARGGSYNYVSSAYLGRTTYKEYYVYYYKTSTVQIVETYQYDDSDGDPFEREPYAVHVHPKVETQLGDFTILGIHVRPDDALDELEELYDVYGTVKTHFDNNGNMLILGTLAADCGYLTSTERQNLDLSGNKFDWLVGDDDDTTTYTTTNCAYDRIIVCGNANQLRGDVVTGQSHIFLFDDFYNLTYQEALDVSGHYPVDVELVP